MNEYLAAIEFEIAVYFIFIILAMLLVIIASISIKFVTLWFQAFVSGTPISLFNIIGMSLRKIPPRVIVNARINAFKAGLKTLTVFGFGNALPCRRPCPRGCQCNDRRR